MKYPNYVQDYINATDVPAKYRNVKYKNEIIIISSYVYYNIV